jgi:hypothetical protein
MNKIQEMLSKGYTMSMYGPTGLGQLSEYLFIGGYNEAESVNSLRRKGITHVLNCAAWRTGISNPYPPHSGVIGYEQFPADDTENYNIMQHFSKAKAFIDRAKYTGGKCLVHCAMGINRSGALCLAYLMIDQNMPLLEAIRRVKQKRGIVLTNRGFQRQLVRFARHKGLL